MVQLKMRKLEIKERLNQLQRAMLNVDGEQKNGEKQVEI